MNPETAAWTKKPGAVRTDARYSLGMNARISIDPDVCHGKPCIAGTRVMVSNVLNLLAHGATGEEVLAGYPALTGEDVQPVLASARLPA